jgi:hypothetical protein
MIYTSKSSQEKYYYHQNYLKIDGIVIKIVSRKLVCLDMLHKINKGSLWQIIPIRPARGRIYFATGTMNDRAAAGLSKVIALLYDNTWGAFVVLRSSNSSQ